MKVPRRRRRQVSTVAGESTKQADKTIACGTPDVSGAFVVTNSCAFYTLRMRLRTHRASGVPRALSQDRARRFPQTSGAPRREIAKPYPALGFTRCLTSQAGFQAILLRPLLHLTMRG
jgi:hypothetical protein